jgi:hypothetical protein
MPTSRSSRLGEASRLLGQLGEEIAEALAGNRQETAIGGDAHDRLGDTEGCDLGVGDPATGVSGLLRQEIVRRAINGSAESVEVGVHRGLSVDGCFSTADFGLSALKSSTATPEAVPRNRLADTNAVESTI